MKKSLLLGITSAFIGVLTGLFLRDWSMTTKICGYIGLGCLLLAGIFEGSFLSGDRIRANYSSETKDTRNRRENIASYFFIISVPNVLAIILLYFLV
ncbi:MAG: DUF5316 domain-containing protein [Syntrophomonas sp.]